MPVCPELQKEMLKVDTKLVHVVIFIIFLSPPHHKDSGGLKKIKTSWNGYASIPSASSKISWKRILVVVMIISTVRFV